LNWSVSFVSTNLPSYFCFDGLMGYCTFAWGKTQGI